jgi:hypothetical protein
MYVQDYFYVANDTKPCGSTGHFAKYWANVSCQHIFVLLLLQVSFLLKQN